MSDSPTNPIPVNVTPVSNTTTIGSQYGTSAAPLASGARVSTPFNPIPTSPTPITPVRRK